MDFSAFFEPYIAPEIISSLIVMGIIALVCIIVGIKARKADPLAKPKGILLVAEYGVEFFDKFTLNLVGDKLPEFGGIIMCLAMYLFLSFIFGLTGLPSPVTYMAVPLSLGLTSFLMIHIVSAKFTKIKYFKRYVDPLPIFLPINLISMWAPLLSLALRLFGNAIAGLTLMNLIYYSLETLSANLFSFISAPLGNMTWGATILPPLITPIFHAYFDLFSGFIQTTVFISLTAIFVGQEIPEDEI